MKNYAVQLYPALEAETGQSVDWHGTGSLRIALTSDRMDEYKHVAGKDKMVSVESELVGPQEMKKIW